MLLAENKVAITTTCDSMLEKAKKLANQLNLPFVRYGNGSCFFFLTLTPDRLELREVGVKNTKPIYVDFLAPNLNYRVKHGGGTKQLIAKAIGIKGGIRPKVLDLTAGFGIDAFVIASLGCEVVALERSPIIGALLLDGLERFKKESLAENIKIEIYFLQAIDYLKNILDLKFSKPDIIYFDPMYPERKKDALGKKTMRILREIVGVDEDAGEVFTLALKCAKNRIVVKRPSYAPSFGSIKPDLKFSAKCSCRYDVYFLKNKEL